LTYIEALSGEVSDLPSSLINLANLAMKVDPIKVVVITITMAIVIMNFLCCVSIWRQRAKAM